MSKGRQYDWPPVEEVQRLYSELGSQQDLADHLGVSRSAVQHFCRRHGIKGASRSRPAGKSAPIDDPKRVKIDQQKAELAALRKENAQYAEELASRKAFLEQIVEETRRPVRPPNLTVKEQSKKLPTRSVIASVFDVQYGQQVLPEDTPGGRGSYSTAIFDKRLTRWFDGVTGSIRDYAASHRISELVIPLGGDFVEGHGIFPGQEWQLEIDPARQVWEWACKFEAAFRELIAFAKEEIGVPKIRFYAVPGNHGKPGGRKAGALHSTHSWDWLAVMLLRDKLRAEPIVEFQIEPGGALYFGAAKHVFLMIHGDEIRGWGGLPFYGLSRYDAKAMRAGHILHDYLLMGDKHVPAEIEQGGGGETLMSGAWVGENNLSRALGAAARPQQRVYFVADKWGVTESVRIYFQGAEESRAPATVHGR